MNMKAFIVVRPGGEFFVIFHAAPDATGTFQWYWMEGPNKGPEINIYGQIYESITLSSDEIRECYQGKWLGCHCHIDGDETPYNQGCVYLTADFGEMIRRNRFDVIEFFGEDGNIRDDLCYVPSSSKTVSL